MVVDRGGRPAAGGDRLDRRVETSRGRVAAGEHAGPLGHAGGAVDLDLAVLEAHAFAAAEEVGHDGLTDGEDHRVGREREP